MDLWTRLWGRYHVPQNVFLVYFYFRLEILFPVAVLQSFDELLGFIYSYGPKHYINSINSRKTVIITRLKITLDQGLDPLGPQICGLTSLLPPSSSLTAWIKVLPVLTSTRLLVRVLVKVLGRYYSRKLLVSGSPTRQAYAPNGLRRWRAAKELSNQ